MASPGYSEISGSPRPISACFITVDILAKERSHTAETSQIMQLPISICGSIKRVLLLDQLSPILNTHTQAVIGPQLQHSGVLQ